MPSMGQVIQLQILWHRLPERNLGAVHIRAAVQVEVAHPLRDILKMAFIRLQGAFHHGTLAQKIGQSRDGDWIQEIDLEIKAIADMISVEGHGFNQGNVRHVGIMSFECIPAVTGRQCLVNREMQISTGRMNL
jgi:hypothetical protein